MYLKYIKLGLHFVCFLIIPIMCSSMNIKLEGLNSELYLHVYKKLSNVDIDVKYIDENLKKKLTNLIQEGLRSLGYYSPHIDFFFV